MDQAVKQLFTWGSLYLAVAVVITTFFVRRIVETAWPSVKKKADENAPEPTFETKFARWWNQVILYAIPVIGGAVLAVVARAAHWTLLAPDTTGGSAIYGGIVGWFSSFLYQVFRRTLKKETGIDPIPGPSDVTTEQPAEPAKPAEAKGEEKGAS